MVGAATTSGRTGSAATDDRVAAWSALLRVHAALVPMLERELAAAHAMPLSWYDVLLELNSAPERRLRMSELGTRVVLSRERVSRVVDELVRAGLVAASATRRTGGRCSP